MAGSRFDTHREKVDIKQLLYQILTWDYYISKVSYQVKISVGGIESNNINEKTQLYSGAFKPSSVEIIKQFLNVIIKFYAHKK